MDSLPHLGRSNNPSLNTDKKDFESPVIKGEICSNVNNMATGSSYARFLNTVILHSRI